MTSAPTTPSRHLSRTARPSQRGAFINNIWHCDCDPRLPAAHFQTKNGGKNHGRWFYTCQKGKPSACALFLWDDDAKIREKSAVISNKHSEPRTPRMSEKTYVQDATTPQTRDSGRSAMHEARATQGIKGPSQNRREINRAGRQQGSSDEKYDWSSSGDDDLAAAAQAMETPRKAARTVHVTSPGKAISRDSHVTSQETLRFLSPPPREAREADKDDVFSTPATSSRHQGLLSPVDTPAHSRFGALPPAQPNFRPPGSSASKPPPGPGDLMSITTPVLDLLSRQNILSPTVREELTNLVESHDLRVQGVLRGREASRAAIQTKEKRITELSGRISALEGEKEMLKTVIATMKGDAVAAASAKPHSHGASPKRRR